MTKRYKIILIFCFLILSICFTGCPFMEQLPRNDKYLEFDFSKENIKINEPVELILRLCYRDLDEDEICAIKVLDNVNIQVLEGKIFEYNDKNAILVEFVQPQNQTILDDESSYDMTPFCKLGLTFKEAGNYNLWFRRTYKDNPNTSFMSGYFQKTITVTE